MSWVPLAITLFTWACAPFACWYWVRRQRRRYAVTRGDFASMIVVSLLPFFQQILLVVMIQEDLSEGKVGEWFSKTLFKRTQE